MLNILSTEGPFVYIYPRFIQEIFNTFIGNLFEFQNCNYELVKLLKYFSNLNMCKIYFVDFITNKIQVSLFIFIKVLAYLSRDV